MTVISCVVARSIKPAFDVNLPLGHLLRLLGEFSTCLDVTWEGIGIDLQDILEPAKKA